MSHKANEARRRNALKSTGPVTLQGKRNSSQNATRHGLLSSAILLDSESSGAFQEMLQDFTDIYHPLDVEERSYIETMAVCRWRLERIWTLETFAIVNKERELLAETPELKSLDPAIRTVRAVQDLADNSTVLRLLNRYSVSLDREYSRALHRLHNGRQARQNMGLENTKIPNEAATPLITLEEPPTPQSGPVN